MCKGVYCKQRAAEKGCAASINTLAEMQQDNDIPTPPPGTHVTVTLLTSAAAAAKYNNKKGVVVALQEGEPAVKVGRATCSVVASFGRQYALANDLINMLVRSLK